MAMNGTNTSEDAEMVEYDGDKVVTMLDVLQEEQDFEEDANAVLGASDDKNCSYNKVRYLIDLTHTVFCKNVSYVWFIFILIISIMKKTLDVSYP